MLKLGELEHQNKVKYDRLKCIESGERHDDLIISRDGIARKAPVSLFEAATKQTVSFDNQSLI